MQLTKSFVTYKGALPDDFCNKVITLGLSKMTYVKKGGGVTTASTADNKEKSNDKRVSSKGLTYSTLKKRGIGYDDIYVRDSEVSWINERWVYDKIQPFLMDANKRAGWNWDIDYSETMQFTVYNGSKTKQQFYGWHADGQSDSLSAYKGAVQYDSKNNKYKPIKCDDQGNYLKDDKGFYVPDMKKEDIRQSSNGALKDRYVQDPNYWGKVRKISMTINLTDGKNYKGGNLKFDYGPHAKNRYKTCTDARTKGSVIVFPSFVQHCVTPITQGTRYSLVVWTLGKPFK